MQLQMKKIQLLFLAMLFTMMLSSVNCFADEIAADLVTKGKSSPTEIQEEIKNSTVVEQKIFTPMRAPVLRAACQQAMKEYQDRHIPLEGTVCGSFMEGFQGGVSVGAGSIVGKTIDPKNPDISYIALKKLGDEILCHRKTYDLYQYIANYLEYIEEHPDFKGMAYEDFLSALYKSCENMKVQKTEEKNGQN